MFLYDFNRCKSARYQKDEKFCKKVLASSQKGCTFAPAFGRNEGREKRGIREAQVL